MSVTIRTASASAEEVSLGWVRHFLRRKDTSVETITCLRFSNDELFRFGPEAPDTPGGSPKADEEEIDYSSGDDEPVDENLSAHPISTFWGLVSHGCFQHLSHLEALVFDDLLQEELNLSGLQLASRKFHLSFRDCEKLRTVRINNPNAKITSVNIDGCHALADMSFLRSLPNLESVELTRNNALKNCSFVNRRTFPNLSRVVIYLNGRCSVLPDEESLQGVASIDISSNANPMVLARE